MPTAVPSRCLAACCVGEGELAVRSQGNDVQGRSVSTPYEFTLGASAAPSRRLPIVTRLRRAPRTADGALPVAFMRSGEQIARLVRRTRQLWDTASGYLASRAEHKAR